MPLDLLQQLNALAGTVGENDRFAVRDGVLSGYVDTRWRKTPAILGMLREAICDHCGAIPEENRTAPRFCTGFEIGTGSAKLYETQWPSGRVIVDVKLQLMRLSTLSDPRVEYPDQIDRLVRTFQRKNINPDMSWLIEPANIDFADPSRARVGMPATEWDVSYAYGTQGPREARRAGIELPSYLRVLSAREEGLLMFKAIVPPAAADKPGTMAIEIGSGSTELVLAGADGRKHAIAFDIARDAQTGLDAIVRGIETDDLRAEAASHLETGADAAAGFIAEARKLRSQGALFMNPSRASAAFRRQSPRHPIDVAWARGYGASNALDKYAAKAKILAALAHAFGFTEIHEGRPGGLKRAMADFVGTAIV